MRSLREHALAPTAPPPGHGWAAFVYGAAQPLLGLRVLFRHRSLAWRGLVPALIILAVAVVITLLDHEYGDGDDVIRRYYAIATAAASIPSVVFANSYARLAAEAHARLGFGERSPLLTRLWSRLVHPAQDGQERRDGDGDEHGGARRVHQA